MSSGSRTNSRARVRVPSRRSKTPSGFLPADPLGGRPGLEGPCHARQALGRVGVGLAVDDRAADVGEHLLGERVVGIVGPGAAQIGKGLGAEQEAEPGRAGAAEEARDLIGGERRELVDHQQAAGSVRPEGRR